MLKSNCQYIPVSEIDRRIAIIEEQLKKLPLELEVLRRLRSQAIEIPKDGDHSGFPLEKLGPKQAILRFLAEQSEPVGLSTVVREVEPVVDSAATDIKRTLYSTLNNLKSTGLVSVIAGRASITTDGREESKKAVKARRQRD